MSTAERPYPLMRPTPTGDLYNVAHGQMRPEFRYADDVVTIDAPDWMPTGGCFSWQSHSSCTIYMQPCGEVRT